MKHFFRLMLNKRFRRVFLMFAFYTLQFWWLGKTKRFRGQAANDEKYRHLYESQAQGFTTAALELGGLLIKLGQFFSSRVDILPKEYTDELAKLQDAVTPVEYAVILKRLETELGDKVENIFRNFSREPLASASLGQVHKAQTREGAEVAVKVLRPGIEEIVAIDLETLKVITAFGKRFTRLRETMDLDAVYIEFRETVLDELDYVIEAKNAAVFRENFAGDERIYIPRMYEEFSTSKVLIMEYIDGIKINEFEALTEAGIDKGEVARILVTSYLRQILVNGFFHADPHPGNLLVKRDGTLVFLDFGMVGYVGSGMKEDFVELALAVFKRDAGAVVESFFKLGFLRPHADRNTLLKSVKLMLGGLYGDDDAFSGVDFNELGADIRELFYSNPFQIPARTVFLGKALNTLIGLAYGLDQEFNLLEVMNPYIGEVFEGKAGLDGSGIILDQAKKVFFEAITIPERLNRLVDGLESGDIRLHPAKSAEQRFYDNQVRQTDRLVKAVLGSGLLITGAQLYGRSVETAYILMALGGLMGLTALLRKGRKVRRTREMRQMPAGFKRPKFHP